MGSVEDVKILFKHRHVFSSKLAFERRASAEVGLLFLLEEKRRYGS
jgi:hypothetical protein